MISLSFLLDGDKMRKRLAQILEQAEMREGEQQKEHEGKREAIVPRTSTFE